MSTAVTTQHFRTSPGCPHPNEVDCKRIQRSLTDRQRYRYVAPSVYPAQNGYRVESPCCSRNVDKEGGVIDIAQLEYLPRQGTWLLYRKDHALGCWKTYMVLDTLAEALDLLKGDPRRMFWP